MKKLRRLTWVAVVFAALLVMVAAQAYAAKKVRIGMFSFGHTRMIGQYLLDEGIAKKWGAKYGVDIEITFPNDDFAAFMGKSVQVITLSSLEAGRLVGAEGLDILMWGKMNSALEDIYVRGDTPYKSPVELKGKKMVIPGWDTGTAQIGTILLKEWWGLDIRNDFRVVVASWPVGPQLLVKGDVDIALNEMPLTLELWRQGKIRPIVGTYATEWAKRTGTGHLLSISLWASFGKWMKGNEKTARAILGASQEGLDYTHTKTQEWANRYRDFIWKNATDAQVKFFVDWFKKYKPAYRNAYLDEKFVSEEMTFLKLAVKAGFVKPSGAKRSLYRIIRP
ncbi:MAG: ABC transporter substrate-binding protein [Nitrospinota bacterium]